MLKTLNTLLFIILITACSADESKEKRQPVDVNQTEMTITKIKSATSSEEKNITKKDIVADATSASTNKVPIFELKTLSGKTLHAKETKSGLIFEEYKDKVVYLLFFGYKCPPCLAEIPHLINIAGEETKDIEIVALEVQGLSEEQLKKFKEKKGINYTLIAGKDHYPFIDYIAQKANWTGSIPFLIVFDKKGDVQVVQVGEVPEKSLRNIYQMITNPKEESNSTK